MKQTTSRSKSTNREEEKKAKIDKNQQRKKRKKTAQAAQGDVAPRQKNRIRHEGEQGSEKEATKAIQETYEKR